MTDVNANISSNDFTITVHFIADDPNAVFQCRLNSREFISCKLTSCMYVCIPELWYRERNGFFTVVRLPLFGFSSFIISEKV